MAVVLEFRSLLARERSLAGKLGEFIAPVSIGVREPNAQNGAGRDGWLWPNQFLGKPEARNIPLPARATSALLGQ